MKILIADDEDYTREGLIESISWEKYGIDEIMQAVNGAEAQQIAAWFHPDIVLTDVRMPKMDGIQFASGFLEQNPDSRVIFMSGYMEIEYLKSAIRLSAIDYIEKPIDLGILEKAIKKAVEEIRETKQTKQVVKDHKEEKQKKLFHLLTSKEADARTVEKIAKDERFTLNQNYLCFMVQLFGTETMPAGISFESYFEGFEGRVLENYNAQKKQFELLVAFKDGESYHLEPAMQKILYKLLESRIGVGIEVKNIKGIYNSYRTAEAAINCSFYQEEQRYFKIDDGILRHSFIEPGIYGEFLQILSEKPEELLPWFEEMFEQFKDKKYYHKDQVYTLMISLLSAVYEKMPELYGVVPEVLKEEQIQSYIVSRKTLKQIDEYIHILLAKLVQKKEEQSSVSRVIRGVREEISHRYQDADLSVASIAEKLHFNPAYLNVLFKQEMKVTIKQYLSNYRLAMAKKILEQGYDKITEIAEQCGYANANYFAKVFREAEGMSPAEYRKEKSDR